MFRSDVCWKKFINAGKYYGRSLILGGDMTKKAIIPFIKLRRFSLDFMENKRFYNQKKKWSQAEKMIADGYYPVRFTPEEIDYYREHPEGARRFTQKTLKRLEDWLAFAEQAEGYRSGIRMPGK